MGLIVLFSFIFVEMGALKIFIVRPHINKSSVKTNLCENHLPGHHTEVFLLKFRGYSNIQFNIPNLCYPTEYRKLLGKSSNRCICGFCIFQYRKWLVSTLLI